jgi:hypothetical protein
MECEECKRLREREDSARNRFYEQKHINRSEGRSKTQDARSVQRKLLKDSRVATARYRLHQAAEHPEMGVKITPDDLDLIHSDGGPGF